MQEELAASTAPLVNSALWAAYGDAVGFISEGTDEKGLKRRLKDSPLRTIPWKRKLGRVGPEMHLPAGCYSDDTQLRLSTSRCIRADGSFSVDLFSAIELPLFPSYALGAGIGTIASARRLLLGTRWHDMVRGANARRYVMGGGNGGAMRIQPHVWASQTGSLDWFDGAIENVLSTHGHPTGLVGALFHGALLQATILSKALVTTKDAVNLVGSLRKAIEIIKAHPRLGPPWLFGWEREAGKSFEREFETACDDLLHGLAAIETAQKRADRELAYHDLLQSLGCLSDSERGSGTKTAIAAFAATHIFGECTPSEMLCVIAAELGSDTDSIATMAGALVGVLVDHEPGTILDRKYIIAETSRLAALALGSMASEFRYANPSIPKDGRVLSEHDGGTVVASLGPAKPSREAARRGSNGELYRWYRLDFGQSMLFHVPPEVEIGELKSKSIKVLENKPTLFDSEVEYKAVVIEGREQLRPIRGRELRTPPPTDPRVAAEVLYREGFEPTRIGRFFLARASEDESESWIGAFFYELARLYKREIQDSQVVTESDLAMSPRAIVRPTFPALNLQLTAVANKKGARVDGMIGNFGRVPAADVSIRLSGNGSTPDVKLASLNVQETNAIGINLSRMIDGQTIVSVTFSAPDGTELRQDGAFEAVPGHSTTFVLKGLGIARLI